MKIMVILKGNFMNCFIPNLRYKIIYIPMIYIYKSILFLFNILSNTTINIKIYKFKYIWILFKSYKDKLRSIYNINIFINKYDKK